jgi:cell fate (sporulation/competence/biofilm development) regulator YlbF (YheA/YmcA/DUF963 family)
MDKAIELAYELKKEIDALPLFQEYKRIKELVDNSAELKELKQEIAKNSTNPSIKKELIGKYNSHPLVVNYNELKNEVKDYLYEICEIINKK